MLSGVEKGAGLRLALGFGLDVAVGPVDVDENPMEGSGLGVALRFVEGVAFPARLGASSVGRPSASPDFRDASSAAGGAKTIRTAGT